MIYLDTSAAAKTLIAEPESDGIQHVFAEGEEFVASRLLAVELNAVVDRRGLSAVDARHLLDRVSLASLSNEVTQRAIDLRSGLRTLVALHLATALSLDSVVTSLLSFDAGLNAGASARHPASRARCGRVEGRTGEVPGTP